MEGIGFQEFKNLASKRTNISSLSPVCALKVYLKTSFKEKTKKIHKEEKKKKNMQ